MEFRSTIAVSLVVVVVLLGGCSGLIGDDGPGSPEEFEYADGYDADGVTDAEAAAESHREGLDNRSSFTVEYGQQIDDVQADVVYQVNVDEETAYNRVDVPSEDYGVESYYGDEQRVTRRFRPEESDPTSEEWNFSTADVNGGDVVAPLLSNATGYESSLEERNGTRVVVYETSGAENASEVFEIEAENVTSFSASLVVDDAGVVHEANYDLTYTDGEEEERTVTLSFQVTDIGETSVDRPDWAAEA